jgi:inorganic pyrophosphatase
VPTRILGAMEMIDDGETDTKLIGVIAVDPRFANKTSLQDLPEHTLKEIKNFFETYKLLQNKKVIVKGFKDLAWANKEYLECVNLMKKYGKLSKDDFLKKMQREHPEKYKV